MEVWFQRATDVVRKLISGDVDIGIVGYDMLREIGNEDPDLVVVHDALGFGGCHLAVAVPQAWEDVNSLRDLMADKRFSAERPLRVVTTYMNLADQFFKDQGFEHVELSTADGALEAAPAMGAADCILDLVSSGTTLRENNLKQIDGGRVLESQGCLVASRTALLERPGTLEIIHEMLERLEAHLRADGLFMVTANVRGASAEEVATKLATSGGQLLKGLQGPTVSPIYTPSADGSPSKEGSFYAVSLAVPKTRIYETVKELRKNGGSGVLTFPLTYVFDEEPPRWSALHQQPRPRRQGLRAPQDRVMDGAAFGERTARARVLISGRIKGVETEWGSIAVGGSWGISLGIHINAFSRAVVVRPDDSHFLPRVSFPGNDAHHHPARAPHPRLAGVLARMLLRTGDVRSAAFPGLASSWGSSSRASWA